MKHILFYILFIPLSLLSFSQNVEGTWTGTLDLGLTKLPLNFNIDNKDGKLIGTLDSPQQGAMGIPLSDVEFKENTLSVSIQALNATYEGVLFGDAIIGKFTQHGQSIPLNLARGKHSMGKRPQEPKPPFSYHSEDVKIKNKSANINLAGTFTYPKIGSNFPVVVLITGSGAQNRDEEILGHKPFLVLSDYLTNHGIAVLRFDDRGVGESEGEFSKATTKDFATDTYAAVEYLKTRKEITTKKIGLIGHSEGGIIAMQLASQYPQDISFIVSMAGTGMSGKEIINYQSKAALLSSGATASTATENHRIAMEMIALVEKHDDEYLKVNAKDLVLKLLPIAQQNEEMQKKMVNELAKVSSPWSREFLAYNPTKDLQRIKGHVLAINGDKDMQVDADTNLKAIESNLIKAKSKTIKKYPNRNHLFQTSTTGSVAEYVQIEETISPEVLKDIANWINGLQ